MHVTINLPVLFTTKLPKSEEPRTALAVVPTEFEIAEYTGEEASLVARVENSRTDMASRYRQLGDDLYARLASTRRNSIREASREQEVDYIVQDVHKALVEAYSDRLVATRIDELYPKDAREIMGWANRGQEEYRQYSQKLVDRLGMRANATAIENGIDFAEALERAKSIAAKVFANNAMIDGIKFRRTQGLVISVECHHNRTVRVSTHEMFSAYQWLCKPGSYKPGSVDINSYYFALTEMDEALRFAGDLGYATGERVVVERDEEPEYLVPVEELPEMDMRYAELVRVAKLACYMVGTEVARRIRNQEHSIFTDDRKLRYAFDDLVEALEVANPFGEPEERVESAARHLLHLVSTEKKDIDSRFRNLATSYEAGFNQLRQCLNRWDERPMGLEFTRGSALSAPGMRA